MSRTTLPSIKAGGSYNHAGVVLTMTIADVDNGNQFVGSGNDLLVIHNTSPNLSANVLIVSSADSYGRTNDIAAYRTNGESYHVVGPLEVIGWQQPDGNIYLSATSNVVMFGIIRL